MQQYNTIYDAVALSLHAITPKLQFAGTETYLNSASGVSFVDDFLNPADHQAGVPLNWLDIHNYDDITGKPSSWEAQLFDQSSGPSSADSFVAEIASINQTRATLDPQMKIDVDELGTFYGTDINSLQPYASYPSIYWNASSAFHAYCFENLAKLGIDVVSMTQLTAYPDNSPSVAMLDWDTGQPNARYQTLKLLAATFHPGVDQLATTTSSSPDVAALAFTGVGTDRLLLINKSDSTQQVIIPKPFYQTGSLVQVIDETTVGKEPAFRPVTTDSVNLKRFAVAVVTTTN